MILFNRKTFESYEAQDIGASWAIRKGDGVLLIDKTKPGPWIPFPKGLKK